MGISAFHWLGQRLRAFDFLSKMYEHVGTTSPQRDPRATVSKCHENEPPLGIEPRTFSLQD